MGKKRTVVPVLVDKDTSWQDEIFDLCHASLVSGNVPKPKVNKQIFLNKTKVDIAVPHGIGSIKETCRFLKGVNFTNQRSHEYYNNFKIEIRSRVLLYYNAVRILTYFCWGLLCH